MAVMNPCCCSLRTGTLVVGVVYICESLIFLTYHLSHALLGVGVGVAVSSSKSDDDNDDTILDDTVETVTLVSLILSIMLLTFWVVNIVFTIVLLIGASQGDSGKCRAWFILTTVFLAFYILYKVVFAVFVMVFAGLLAGLVIILIDIFFFLVFVIVTCYQLWVVYAYVDELRNGNRTGADYPGVVYSITPKQDEQQNASAPAPQFAPMDYGSPPPYQPTTYAPTYDAESRPRGAYNPASVGYPVLPVLKQKT